MAAPVRSPTRLQEFPLEAFAIFSATLFVVLVVVGALPALLR
jgi:hypothetical protein